jgi:hypothetical protein
MTSQNDRHAEPDIVLERYVLGELPSADAERLERRLREDPVLRRRLEAIEESNATLERDGAMDRLVDRVRAHAVRSRAERPAAAGPRVTRWLAPVAVAAAAVAVVTVSLPGARARLGIFSSPSTGQSGVGLDGDRVKGLKPSLALFRKAAAGTEKLAEGSVLRAGDLVRVAYQGAGRPYGVILSVDGRGSVTIHLPPSGATAARLRGGDRVLLDQAYELDDAPRWEKFYLVTGNAPFAVAPVVEAARRAAAAATAAGPPALVVGPGQEQVGMLFIKEGKS